MPEFQVFYVELR